jgi:hypothetical protein
MAPRRGARRAGAAGRAARLRQDEPPRVRKRGLRGRLLRRAAHAERAAAGGAERRGRGRRALVQRGLHGGGHVRVVARLQVHQRRLQHLVHLRAHMG